MNLAATGTHRRKSNAIPYARWHDRYVEWFTELGFLGKPGEETKAAREVAAYARKVKQ